MSIAQKRCTERLVRFALLLALAGSACDFNWRGTPPMETQQFSEVYVALLRVMAGDSLPPARADSVFKAYRLDARTFQAASRYYSDQSERWAEVLRLVVARLDSAVTAESRQITQDSLLGKNALPTIPQKN